MTDVDGAQGPECQGPECQGLVYRIAGVAPDFPLARSLAAPALCLSRSHVIQCTSSAANIKYLVPRYVSYTTQRVVELGKLCNVKRFSVAV